MKESKNLQPLGVLSSLTGYSQILKFHGSIKDGSFKANVAYARSLWWQLPKANKATNGGGRFISYAQAASGSKQYLM